MWKKLFVTWFGVYVQNFVLNDFNFLSEENLILHTTKSFGQNTCITVQYKGNILVRAFFNLLL